MYEEFLIGYIISGVAVLFSAIVLILQCVILKKLSRMSSRPTGTFGSSYSQGGPYSGARSTAVCRHCATQFDAAHAVCPKCGMPR